MTAPVRLTGKGKFLVASLTLAFLFSWGEWSVPPCAVAEEPVVAGTPVKPSDGEYHTPLAGEAGEAFFLGHSVPIPARDRSDITAIVLGGTFMTPKQGSTAGMPVFALFLKRDKEEYRTRDAISIFVNEFEFDKRFNNFELVTHLENYTLPGDITELRDNRQIDETAVTWGTATASFGPGLRIPIAPFQTDNNLRLQLLGQLGFMYAEGSHETGPNVIVPPNTWLYGGKIRGRYDTMRRNLLELLHEGVAGGFDLGYMHRNNWRSLTPSSSEVHDDFVQGNAYLIGASGIPGLSEKNRLLFYANGGMTNPTGADRYNAFLLNGGAFAAEEDDLVRPHYGGAFYDHVRVTKFATASLSYRRELTFFLYLSLVGSYIWGDRATVEGLDQVVFREKTGTTATIALDSACFANSSLYLAYTWDSGFVREGRSGSAVTLVWNKEF